MTQASVLFLTHRVPHPPNRGDRIRTYNFLRHLAQHAKVTLACLADEPVSNESRRVLNDLCEQTVIIPVSRVGRWIGAGLSFAQGRSISQGAFRSKRLSNAIQRISTDQKFDAVLCSSSALVDYLLTPELQNVSRYVDLIDVDSQKWADYAVESRGLKRLLYRYEAQRLLNVETDLQTWADGICVVSEPEAQLYRDTSGKTDILHAIPNGVDTDFFTPDVANIDQQNGCVFVGALDYKPNVDGIVWFTREIWPEIRRQRPNETLDIVGREPVNEVKALSEIAGVNVVGTVPDIRTYLNRSKVAVVPLRIARGVQNKVLEALAMSKAVVASPEPIVGLNVDDGTHLFSANLPEEWVQRVLQLMDDPILRNDLGLAGQAYVCANHRWNQCLSSLPQFLGISGIAGQPNSRSEFEVNQNNRETFKEIVS